MESFNNLTRDKFGRFVSLKNTTSSATPVNTTNPPDLVDIKISNPLVYIKYWWKRIMANEGIEVKFKAKPVTVFGVALIWSAMAFGLGGVVLPTFFPWVKVNNLVISSPTPTSITQIMKDTALRGTLTKTSSVPSKFYLVTTSTEAVTLEVPDNFNLNLLVGKRILAVGSYDSKNKILVVKDIQNLEVLSKTPVPIPTVSTSPKPTETPTVIPSASPTTEATSIPSDTL